LVGLTTTAQLAAFPLGRLVAVDGVAERRRLAEAFGADEALTPEAAREAFDPNPPGETGEDTAATGADVSLELSGDPEALDDAIAATGYAGRVVVGSWYGTKRANLDLGGRFHRSRIDVQSSQVSTIAPGLRGRWDDDRRLRVAWDRLRALDADRLLTHRFPIEDADRAYSLIGDKPGGPVGILFTYGDT
jgi:threonine dehydrogenase-like Zn-dependent dehydrogenase